MTTYVLDASAGVELLVDTDRGRAIQAQLVAGAEWWVPEHYYSEVAGALRRGELTGAYTPERTKRAFDNLTTAAVRRAQVRPLLAEAWSLRANLTVADAVYVVLADHLDATLVTADIRLAQAPNLPVPTVHP